MSGLFQPMHLLIILGIVLLIFGPSKIPELGSSIGNALKGFKKAMEEKEQAPEGVIDNKKIENK